jgi:Ca2+-binding RTX toxin-like protein
MASKRNTARWIVLLAACFLPAAGAVPAVAAKSDLSCSYVTAGPPGAVGNLLEIGGSGDVVIGRDGEEITVALSSSGYGLRAEPPLTCVGGIPTVTNVDQIVHAPATASRQILIDERAGRLEPGVSPEPGSDEIELSLEIPRTGAPADARVFVLGAPGADFLVAGDLSGGRVGVDLNRGRAAVERDVDLRIAAPRSLILQLDGGDGSDRVTVRGGSGFAAPLSLQGVSLQGGLGADLILGGPRVDHIDAGEGDDAVRGYGGGDFVYAGAGRDLVQGGGGDDWIRNDRGPEEDAQHDVYLGGPGDDYIASRLGGRDEVRCGGGFDEAWVDPFDAWAGRGCEQVQVAKATQ